jgi:hypothetical protein
MTNDNAEKSCYYCNGPIPPEALLCPSCRKERKELHELRMGWWTWAVSGFSCLAVALCILAFNFDEAIHRDLSQPQTRWARWQEKVGREATTAEIGADAFKGGYINTDLPKYPRVEYRFSLAKMLSDWLFWFALGLGVPALICSQRSASYSTRYFCASGKKIRDLARSV